MSTTPPVFSDPAGRRYEVGPDGQSRWLDEAGTPPQHATVVKKPKRWLVPTIVGVVAFFVGAGLGAAGAGVDPAATAEPTVTVTQEAAAGPAVTVTAPAATVTTTATVQAAPPKPTTTVPGDGTFEVNVDIPAGKWKSSAPDSGNCYWARLSDQDSLNGIIANNNSSGPSLVVIKKTDKFFETNGCSEWAKVG